MTIDKTISNSASAMVTAVLSPLIEQCLVIMIPWLIAMALVISVDLIAGVHKSLKLGVHVSISTAVRNTMGKMITYFAFVCMVAVVDVASGKDWGIAVYSCLLICGIEMVSILGNILKPHGYDLSLASFVKVFVKRIADVAEEDAEQIIHNDKISDIREREKEKWKQCK